VVHRPKNSITVIDKKVSQEYPTIEQRWIDSEFKEIMEERMSGVKKRMNI